MEKKLTKMIERILVVGLPIYAAMFVLVGLGYLNPAPMTALDMVLTIAMLRLLNIL